MGKFSKEAEKELKTWALEKGIKKGLELLFGVIKAWIEDWRDNHKDKKEAKKLEEEKEEIIIDKIEVPVQPLKITWIPSPHFSARKNNEIDAIIIHHTGDSIKSALSWMQMKESKVSYHYLIAKNGDIYQMVKEANKAWHAGVSTLETRTNVNTFSIGVAFEGKGEKPEPYTKEQYEAGAKLCKLLKKKYEKITNGRIVGHKHIAPERKHDPANFDWARFYGLVGN